ncbi:MAG: bifunctional hydroxymethylpyrimidine kinase/phosphomethylpyrimidine kinase [Aliishimia sp.]
MIPNVLSIAGSDPSGGAGIQADLKAISANAAYAMAVITALTAQNTVGVSGIHGVPPDFVKAQIGAIFDDIRVDAVKIGMVATADIVDVVAQSLAVNKAVPIVLDPVMIAKGGAQLLGDDAVAVLRERLVPISTVLTPNLPEAAHLLETNVAKNRAEMAEQGAALCALGPQAVLMKGGHLDEDDSPDCLVTAHGVHWFEAARHKTRNTHGTGCTLSSALAAQLTKGLSVTTAVAAAKVYVTTAIKHSDKLSVGSGHGPIHHFANLCSQ